MDMEMVTEMKFRFVEMDVEMSIDPKFDWSKWM